MDRAKLKLMVRNLELLVDDIKAEVFSDVELLTFAHLYEVPMDKRYILI